MGDVYAVQRHLVKFGSKLVDKYDLSPAEKFGALRFCIETNLSPFRPDEVVPILEQKLTDFGDDDHLLLIGNPVFIGLAFAIAADNNGGYVKVLQWSGKNSSYEMIQCNLGYPQGDE